eukprot:evm.model.scf_23.17 EVM.evm.TU.scf_23.17   scf_23:193817-200790(-)
MATGGVDGAWAGSEFAKASMASLGMTIASEVGDKTFFIAAVMAMRNPRLKVFTGCLSALVLMTVLSAALGWATPALIPKLYTHHAATILFFFFGFAMLRESFKKSEGEDGELEQAEYELTGDLGKNPNGDDIANGKRSSWAMNLLRLLFSRIFLKAFSLTFLAEWGDRSQIATIGLAASRNVYGVVLGGVLGHTACTGLAVLGGKQLAAHINERMVAIFGGLLFLLFGAISLYEGPG